MVRREMLEGVSQAGVSTSRIAAAGVVTRSSCGGRRSVLLLDHRFIFISDVGPRTSYRRNEKGCRDIPMCLQMMWDEPPR